jgi:hypothetical protein
MFEAPHAKTICTRFVRREQRRPRPVRLCSLINYIYLLTISVSKVREEEGAKEAKATP